MRLKPADSIATSSPRRPTARRRLKSFVLPMSSAVLATMRSGRSALPATSHDAMSAARSAGTAEMIRNTTTPERFDAGTRVD